MVFTLNHIKFGIPLEEVEFIAENMGHLETSTSSGHILGNAILREDVTPIITKEKLCIKHAICYQQEIILVLDTKKLIADIEE